MSRQGNESPPVIANIYGGTGGVGGGGGVNGGSGGTGEGPSMNFNGVQSLTNNMYVFPKSFLNNSSGGFHMHDSNLFAVSDRGSLVIQSHRLGLVEDLGKWLEFPPDANDAANSLKIIINKMKEQLTPRTPAPSTGFQLATTIADGRYRIINKATGFHLTAGIVHPNGIPHNNYLWTYNPCPSYGWYIDPELCIFTVKNVTNGHEITNNRLITRYVQSQGAFGVPLVGSASTAVRILTVPNNSGCYYIATSLDPSPAVIRNVMAGAYGPQAHHVTSAARAGDDSQQMWRFERVN